MGVREACTARRRSNKRGERCAMDDGESAEVVQRPYDARRCDNRPGLRRPADAPGHGRGRAAQGPRRASAHHGGPRDTAPARPGRVLRRRAAGPAACAGRTEPPPDDDRPDALRDAPGSFVRIRPDRGAPGAAAAHGGAGACEPGKIRTRGPRPCPVDLRGPGAPGATALGRAARQRRAAFRYAGSPRAGTAVPAAFSTSAIPASLLTLPRDSTASR